MLIFKGVLHAANHLHMENPWLSLSVKRTGQKYPYPATMLISGYFTTLPHQPHFHMKDEQDEYPTVKQATIAAAIIETLSPGLSTPAIWTLHPEHLHHLPVGVEHSETLRHFVGSMGILLDPKRPWNMKVLSPFVGFAGYRYRVGPGPLPSGKWGFSSRSPLCIRKFLVTDWHPGKGCNPK